MTTKLTLTIEESVIERAKEYAKSRKHSLSNLIENYLKTLVKVDESETVETTPVVASLRGSFSEPENFDYDEILTKALSDKYL